MKCIAPMTVRRPARRLTLIELRSGAPSQPGSIAYPAHGPVARGKRSDSKALCSRRPVMDAEYTMINTMCATLPALIGSTRPTTGHWRTARLHHSHYVLSAGPTAAWRDTMRHFAAIRPCKRAIGTALGTDVPLGKVATTLPWQAPRHQNSSTPAPPAALLDAHTTIDCPRRTSPANTSPHGGNHHNP